jgi:hypothetical protein
LLLLNSGKRKTPSAALRQNPSAWSIAKEAPEVPPNLSGELFLEISLKIFFPHGTFWNHKNEDIVVS